MDSDTIRGFTHPVTNFTGLSAPEIRADLAGVLFAKPMRTDTWLSFVHEFTHHWCFNTPVGLALAHLYLRPLRLREEADIGADNDTWNERIGIEVLCYEVAMGLLHPLIEGLAVFAEFDLIPDPDSKTYSDLLTWTLLLYANQYAPAQALKTGQLSSEEMDHALLNFLVEARSSRQAVIRKSAVLAEPLRNVANGYLANYLFVKNLWMRLGSADRRLQAPDTFLMFLNAFLFSDLELVARLLAREEEFPVAKYEELAACLNAKMMTLTRGDILPLREKFDRWQDQRPVNQSVYTEWRDIRRQDLEALPSWNDDLPSWNRGIDLLTTELRTLTVKSADTTVGRIRNALMWLISQRGAFCFLQGPVRVHVSSEGRVSAHTDNPIVSFPTPGEAKLPPGDYDGQISGYLLPGLRSSFVCASVDGSIVEIAFSSNGLREELKEQFWSYRVDGLAYLEGLEEGRRELRQAVMHDPIVEVIADAVEENLAQWYQRSFAEGAFPGVDPAESGLVADLFDKAGLAAITGSAARLRGLAALSLMSPILNAAGLERAYERLREVHGCSDSFQALFDYLQAKSAEIIREPLFYAHGDGLLCAV